MDMIKYLQPFKESSLLEQKTLKRHEVSLEDISSPRKKSKVLPSFDASMANNKIVPLLYIDKEECNRIYSRGI